MITYAYLCSTKKVWLIAPKQCSSVRCLPWLSIQWNTIQSERYNYPNKYSFIICACLGPVGGQVAMNSIENNNVAIQRGNAKKGAIFTMYEYVTTRNWDSHTEARMLHVWEICVDNHSISTKGVMITINIPNDKYMMTFWFLSYGSVTWILRKT